MAAMRQKRQNKNKTLHCMRVSAKSRLSSIIAATGGKMFATGPDQGACGSYGFTCWPIN